MKLLIMYIALPITLIVTCLFVILFSDDVYRYPCQDPNNWGLEECLPPACESSGVCTKYLVQTSIEEEITQQEDVLSYDIELQCTE